MRININLASHPYELAREYKRRMTILIAALAALAVMLVGYIVYQRTQSRSINRQLADLQRQMDVLNREESQARALLNRPGNRTIADQSEFLNDLFARKSMSWTHIFTVMEKIVPPELHVTSMKPEYSKTGDLVLHVIVATDSRDRANELMRNMEKSNHFREPKVLAESVVANTSEQGQSGNTQFDIAAIYVPGSMEADENQAADGASDPTAAPNASPAMANAPASRAQKPMSSGPGAAGSTQPGVNIQPNVNAAQNRPDSPAARMRGH